RDLRCVGETREGLGREQRSGKPRSCMVVAVPGDVITIGLTSMRGLAGQITIDATNRFGSIHPPTRIRHGSAEPIAEDPAAPAENDALERSCSACRICGAGRAGSPARVGLS